MVIMVYGTYNTCHIYLMVNYRIRGSILKVYTCQLDTNITSRLILRGFTNFLFEKALLKLSTTQLGFQSRMHHLLSPIQQHSGSFLADTP